MHRMLLAAVALTFLTMEVAVAFPAANGQELVSRQWPHRGLFAKFDHAALKRGLQVYREVCASCHSLRFVAYRDLTGIGFTMSEAEAIAAQDVLRAGTGEAGETITRSARVSDRFVAPFSHDRTARAANNRLLPPDLSHFVKAREDGENYLYSILVGVSVPPPLEDNAVAYADGTAATSGQMAVDVVSFLAWAAEPSLEERSRLGLKWMLFFAALTGFLYFVKRRIWAKLD